MTKHMRAVEIREPGGPEVLTLVDRPIPEPGAGEVLLRVGYAGVTRPDAWTRAGMYRAPADASARLTTLPSTMAPNWAPAPLGL